MSFEYCLQSMHMDIKNGISPSRVFLGNTDKTYVYVIDFLADRFPSVSKEEWLARIEQSLVLDQDGVPLPSDAPYSSNTYIYYYRQVDHEEPIPFEETIIYQDDHLLIADKPHFLPVTPGGHYLQETLLVRLKNKTGLQNLSPIHRIDRETAGLVAFSKSALDRNLYQALFRERAVEKEYEAIAPYRDDLSHQFPIHYQSRLEESEVFIQMHEVSGEANSDTVIHLMEIKGLWAKYQLQLGSGKKHQLRVHMSALGIPIKNDLIYPKLQAHVKTGHDFSQPLQLLAKELRFKDPITGLEHYFSSQQALHL